MGAKELRRRLALRDGPYCHYCGSICDPADGRRVHIEHKVARANGGTNAYMNLALACAPCNLFKGPRNAEDVYCYFPEWAGNPGGLAWWAAYQRTADYRDDLARDLLIETLCAPGAMN